MFISLALILFFGAVFSLVSKYVKLPSLLGYLLIGIVLGPYVLNLIDPGILDISADIRKIALIIILIRAGLSLDLADLKKIGRPAILMSFIPAVFEMVTIGLIAPMFFPITYLDAFIMGAVLGAVSPAVVVPRMVQMIEDQEGTQKGIPQLIIAGSSIDDVVVIVFFTTFIGLENGSGVALETVLNVPASILLGIAAGIGVGLLLSYWFKKAHVRDSLKVAIILAVSFGMVALETLLTDILGFSSLLATITMGIVILKKLPAAAQRISNKYSKLWIIAEIFLFVLVGASVDLSYAWQNMGQGIVVIVIGLAIRSLGVLLSISGKHYTAKEKAFCCLAYTPKATVQAAIGGIPLALGLACGNAVLSVAVISILFTAPLGAFAIDLTRHWVRLEKPQTPPPAA